MLSSGIPTVALAALAGALVGFGGMTGGTIAMFVHQYFEVKKPEAQHRDALPAYCRVWVSIDWSAASHVYGKVCGAGALAGVALYIFATGLQEVFL